MSVTFPFSPKLCPSLLRKHEATHSPTLQPQPLLLSHFFLHLLCPSPSDPYCPWLCFLHSLHCCKGHTVWSSTRSHSRDTFPLPLRMHIILWLPAPNVTSDGLRQTRWPRVPWTHVHLEHCRCVTLAPFVWNPHPHTYLFSQAETPLPRSSRTRIMKPGPASLPYPLPLPPLPPPRMAS